MFQGFWWCGQSNQQAAMAGLPFSLASTCLSIPAHQTLLWSLCLVFVNPSCPSWARSTTPSRNFSGISNLVPLRTSLPSMESSFLTALYCGGALSHSPIVMHSLNYETSGSTHDSSSTSRTDIAAGVDASATNRITLPRRHSSIPLPLPRRESGSVMFYLPGTYCTLNLYDWSLRTQRSTLAELREFVEYITSRGFWSVSMVNSTPYAYT